MSIQFNKMEEEKCKEIIKEWYQKEGQNLSHLRVTFEMRAKQGFKRHSMTETARLVRTRLEKYKKLMADKKLLQQMRERNSL